MAEYIEREAISKALNDNILNDPNCPLFVASTIQQIIDCHPSADVEPVRHGVWGFGKKHGDFVEANCTACDGVLLVKWYDSMSRYHYCPNCGAKMDLEE